MRTDGTITCWGWNEYAATAPDGQAPTVTAGSGSSCGLRTDGTSHLLGPKRLWRAGRAVRARGLRTDGTITCWGELNRTDWAFVRAAHRRHHHLLGQQREATAPGGQYTAVTAGGYSCALRTDATITCWGDNDEGQATAPDGQPTDPVEPPGNDGPPVDQLPY